MYSLTEEHGLAVVRAQADELTVDRALKQLDARFFLDRERDSWGRIVYVAKLRLHSGRDGIQPVVVWADADGAPMPLTLGLVDKVRALEVTRKEQVVTGALLAESARRVRERQADEARADREDLIREHEHRLSPAHGKPVTITTPLER